VCADTAYYVAHFGMCCLSD